MTDPTVISNTGRVVVECEGPDTRVYSWEWWTERYAIHYRRCLLKGEDPQKTRWTTHMREVSENDLVKVKCVPHDCGDGTVRASVHSVVNGFLCGYFDGDGNRVEFSFVLDKPAQVRAERLEIIARALKHLEETPREVLVQQIANPDPEAMAERFRDMLNATDRIGQDIDLRMALFGVWKEAQTVLHAAGLPYN